MRIGAAIALLGSIGLGLMGFALAPRLDLEAARRVPSSGMLLDRHGEMLQPALNVDESWCFPESLNSISPYLVNATLAVEDQRFRSHVGVDPIAVMRAAWTQLRGGVRSGASTLTMQAVNLSGHRSSSPMGKLGQMALALQLDRSLSKDAILELYLNKVPYGFNLIGAEAAARRYFGKPAKELTLPEAALLAGMPKAPSRYQPLRDPERAKERRNHVLARMEAEGFIGSEESARAMASPLGTAWHDFPAETPHLAAADSHRLGEGEIVRLTIDAEIQAMVQRAMRRHLNRYSGDISNAAVMVVDVATREVLARVGSAGFHSVPGGQVDMCTAARSPGSTLKPFTYALAIEDGLLYPTEKLLDDTIDFGSYAPENFDGVFNGLVSATQALQLSLNVPAVAALDRVGLARMQTFLGRAGLTTLTRPPSHYGLGLTLGNCGVRLDELCAAYASVANLGVYHPLMMEPGVEPGQGRRILREDTAGAIYQMLEHPFPREPQGSLVKGSNPNTRVCWKTGTSTGFHDAWTVAFNRHYVVGVWVGNADGTPSPRLVGALAALPLAATIFRTLPESNAPSWPDAESLEQPAVVCATTGLPAGTHCPATERNPLPSGQYLNRRCDVHYPGGALRWPADARHWNLAQVHSPVELPLSESARSLRITAPANGARYVLTGEPEGDRVLLRSSVDSDIALSWYLHGRFLGNSDASQPLQLDLSKGSHTLTCMAPDGQADTVNFNVVLPHEVIAMSTEAHP